MKALFTLSLLFFLSVSFAQDSQEHVLTIYLTDSLSGKPAQVESAYAVEAGSNSYMVLEPSAEGVFAVRLKEGEYTLTFKHQDGRSKSITVDLTEDVTKNIMFSTGNKEDTGR